MRDDLGEEFVYSGKTKYVNNDGVTSTAFDLDGITFINESSYGIR